MTFLCLSEISSGSNCFSKVTTVHHEDDGGPFTNSVVYQVWYKDLNLNSLH
jgi:hypothetical protein